MRTNEDNVLGGPGTCRKCGKHVSNRSYHEANCQPTAPTAQPAPAREPAEVTAQYAIAGVNDGCVPSVEPPATGGTATPRTEQEVTRISKAGLTAYGLFCEMTDFARTLETELAEASTTARIEFERSAGLTAQLAEARAELANEKGQWEIEARNAGRLQAQLTAAQGGTAANSFAEMFAEAEKHPEYWKELHALDAARIRTLETELAGAKQFGDGWKAEAVRLQAELAEASTTARIEFERSAGLTAQLAEARAELTRVTRIANLSEESRAEQWAGWTQRFTQLQEAKKQSDFAAATIIADLRAELAEARAELANEKGQWEIEARNAGRLQAQLTAAQGVIARLREALTTLQGADHGDFDSDIIQNALSLTPDTYADALAKAEEEVVRLKHDLFIEEQNRNQLAILGHENTALRAELAELRGFLTKQEPALKLAKDYVGTELGRRPSRTNEDAYTVVCAAYERARLATGRKEERT